MRVDQFDPLTDRESLRAFYDVYTSCGADDPNGPVIALSDTDPVSDTMAFSVRGQLQGPRLFAGLWTSGEPAVQRTWLARSQSGEVLGCCLVELPEGSYPDVVFALIAVRPQERRRGVGRALLETVRQRIDRGTLISYVRAGTAGDAFLRALGAQPDPPTNDTRRILRLDEASAQRTRSLKREAAAQAAGYSLFSWSDEAPEEVVDSLAVLMTTLNEDAPRPDAMAPEQVDRDSIRTSEARRRELGIQRAVMTARHEDTGELVALSAIGMDPLLPGWAFQGVTVVRRDHRGHRLGTWVKAALYQDLTERYPQVSKVMTTNHASNGPMIAVNDLLGFEVTDEFTTFRLELKAD
jgi:GNAT superfamily N-acetyltransferase